MVEFFIENIFSVVFSIILTAVIEWVLKKRRQKRMVDSIDQTRKIEKGPDHAALVVELTNDDIPSMMIDVKRSIPLQKKMKPLTDNLIKAEALPADAFTTINAASGFQCGCSERFVTITNKNRMPDDTESAKKYIVAFNSTLSSVFRILRRNGVTTLHVFYHGPMPLLAYLGAKCTAKFNTFFYHFSIDKNSGTKRYYLLSSGELVKYDAPADEKQ